MTRRTRRSSEEGAQIVEFAIVSLVLFLLFFGMIDIGIVEIGNTAASNAARAGARVGILNPVGASTPGTSSNTAIRNAVTSKLAGLARNPIVSVACLSGANGVTPLANCDTTQPDYDLLRVTVTWTHKGISPFISTTTKTDTATMVIVSSGGAAGAASASTTCVITAASTVPGTVSITSGTSGTLTSSFEIDATGSDACGTEVWAEYYPESTSGSLPQIVQMNKANNTYRKTINTPTQNWTLGEHPIRFVNSALSSRVQHAGASTTINVVSPSVCSVTSAAITAPTNVPPSVQLTGSAPSTVSGTVTVRATTTAACTSLYARYTPDATVRTDIMSASGTTFTLTVPSTVLWSTGLKSFTFTDGGSPGTTYDGPAATVQVNPAPPGCLINVNFTNTDTGVTITSVEIREHGQLGKGILGTPITVTVTVQPGATCTSTIWVQWDKGFGFTASVASAVAMSSPAPYVHLIPKETPGSTTTWNSSGVVTFRFLHGATKNSAAQLTPLTPVTLDLIEV